MRPPLTSRLTARRSVALTAIAAAILLGAACGGDDAAGDATQTAPPASSTATGPATTAPAVDPPDGAERVVDLFFLTADGRLAKRVVIAQEGMELTAALSALAEGPREPGLVRALPAGTQVRGVTLADQTATVDLSAEFVAGYPSGGAAAELEILGPVVYTLTSVPGVRRVLITVEGAVPDLSGSGFDLSQPLERADVPAEFA